ncbi:MAG: hypothetical protein RMJ37_04455 [Spirochaetia bacterium]|nr:hypothetical protein [Spirochaetota bacterium]MCX8097282.1 hypothetical protein [Spirochaetota bacterium]MDW8112579.1 hypothetical protein [Spirochaetia bacterium]
MKHFLRKKCERDFRDYGCQYGRNRYKVEEVIGHFKRSGERWLEVRDVEMARDFGNDKCIRFCNV